jgi:hypothetical protein
MIFVGYLKTSRLKMRQHLEIGLRFKGYGLYERVDKINRGALEASVDISVSF